MKAFFRRFFTKPPIFLPLLALFHWGLAIFHFSGWESGSWLYLSKGLWFLTAAIFATVLALMKRWAGIAYILLTCAGLLLYFFNREGDSDLARLGQTLFPVDIIVCFLILFFYKRLEGWPARTA